MGGCWAFSILIVLNWRGSMMRTGPVLMPQWICYSYIRTSPESSTPLADRSQAWHPLGGFLRLIGFEADCGDDAIGFLQHFTRVVPVNRDRGVPHRCAQEARELID